MEAKEVSILTALEKEEDFEPCGLPDIYLRVALWGGVSSGKSYTAISLASGLGEKIAVLETLGGQIRHYRNLAEFSVLEVPDGSPQRLIDCIDRARGYDVLVVDTASSEWVGPGSILDIVETMPPNKEKASPWRVASPLHNRFMEALLSFPGHVICTFQARHEFIIINGEAKRVATHPVWRDGTEFAFNMVAYMKNNIDSVSMMLEKCLFHKLPLPVIVNPSKEDGVALRKLVEEVSGRG